MKIIILITFFIFLNKNFVYSNKVIEITDKFLEVYNNTSKSWLIKFYTTWCHHCKKLESDYMHVAQILHNEEIEVIVSKVDANRFYSIAKHFKVFEYPTILFVNKRKIIKYENNNFKNDIVDFVKRVIGDEIKILNHCQQINQLPLKHESLFIYFGQKLSKEFKELSKHHIKNTWFYFSNLKCYGFEQNSTYSIKKSLTTTPYITKYDTSLNISMVEWVNYMHYPKFINLTKENLNKVLDSKKMIVIVLVKKYISLNKFFNPIHKKFYTNFEKISHLFIDDFFLFGWTSEFDLIRNIAIYDFQNFPTFIVLNSLNNQYYWQNKNLTKDEIIVFLENIKMNNKNLEVFGGNNLFYKISRSWFSFNQKFSKTYNSNSLMAILLIALPTTLLLVLFWGCYKYFLDANEDDEVCNSNEHFKTD